MRSAWFIHSITSGISSLQYGHQWATNKKIVGLLSGYITEDSLLICNSIIGEKSPLDTSYLVWGS